MKLSIETYVLCKRFGPEAALRMIAEAGFDAADFSYYWLEKDTPLLGENFEARARALRAYADTLGLSINQAHAPFDENVTQDAERRRYEHTRIERAIISASILGARQIIIHNLQTPDPADFYRTNLAYFRSFEETAKKWNIAIAVENLWSRENGQIVGGRFSTPDELSRVLDELGSEHFCGCIDVGHSHCVGFDASRFIRELGGEKLKALHVQDTDLKSDTHQLPFIGKHDWRCIMGALREVGYDGDLTLEVFAYLSGFPDALLPSALKLACDTGRYLMKL